MLYVRARGAATPRVAPHRPGPAPPHAAGMLISSGHSSTSVESAIASLQLGAAEMRRWWRAGAGAALPPARAGTLEQDDYSAGNCPQLHSQREAAAGEQSRAGGGQPGSTATATTTPCPAPHPHWTQCQDYAPITAPIHIK